jgi:hypothetical protein
VLESSPPYLAFALEGDVGGGLSIAVGGSGFVPGLGIVGLRFEDGTVDDFFGGVVGVGEVLREAEAGNGGPAGVLARWQVSVRVGGGGLVGKGEAAGDCGEGGLVFSGRRDEALFAGWEVIVGGEEGGFGGEE